ncbi:type VII secretion protein EsaA [Rathayibacter rathayi]|nr:type VII secretion protein EsaA [Rathayibacter rathayi]MWV75446.1 type VII secretion protein EsaA [Rathayibacter rathayi NCPPB 2980 = VKM Ac-1601]TWD70849.1 type VII secretion EsaA-like protein [Rathayibacter rathayi]SOE05454.1 type VII secretion protein EsaA, N-terminal domain-containing protein [Rathayibacter rathayi NCPPB 2980 = VKM Ac-1601]
MANVSTQSRSRLARLSSAAMLLIALCMSFLPVNADAAQGADDVRPTVGLVNEDLASEFNGDEYTFGTSFVDRISKDSEYNWIVLSRSVAEKAYSDGSVDAILYIPQSFTRDILTLQDTNPTKATVEYKLEPQADKRADQLLEARIIAIVSGFNESVIKMYYASLADNLAEADGQMHGTLSNQEALITALTTDVQKPFSGTIPNIENFVSSAKDLKDVNTATVEAQNTFTKSVADSLTSSSEALSGQLQKIDEYARRQQEIAQINATNSNKGIADQAASDRRFYGSQFEALKASTLCKLAGLDATDLPAPCTRPDGTSPPHLDGRIAELQQAIAQYRADHTLAIDNLSADLDTRIQNLKAVETRLSGSAAPVNPADPADPRRPSVPAGVGDPAIVASLQEEILALETTRDSLRTGLPGPTFDSALTNVDTWYNETIASLKEASLTENTVTSLKVGDWSSRTPDSSGLFIDSSDDLRTSITGLVSQTDQTSSQITSSAGTVPDNTSQFDALLKNATTTFDGVENVFTGLNKFVATGNTGLKETQDYYANFASVLANTRTPGVDTSGIYDFFAAPINAKNITSDHTAAADATDPVSWFEPQWVAVFGGGLFAGILATVLSGAFRRRKKA